MGVYDSDRKLKYNYFAFIFPKFKQPFEIQNYTH